MVRFLADHARRRRAAPTKQSTRSETLRAQLKKARDAKRSKMSVDEQITKDVNDVFNKITDDNIAASTTRLDALAIKPSLLPTVVDVIFSKFMDCSMLTSSFLRCLTATKHGELLSGIVARADQELTTPTTMTSGKIEISSNEVRLNRWKKAVRLLYVHLFKAGCITRTRLIEVWETILNEMITDRDNCTHLVSFCDLIHKLIRTELNLSADERERLIAPMYITDTSVIFRYRHQLKLVANKFASS